MQGEPALGSSSETDAGFERTHGGFETLQDGEDLSIFPIQHVWGFEKFAQPFPPHVLHADGQHTEAPDEYWPRMPFAQVMAFGEAGSARGVSVTTGLVLASTSAEARGPEMTNADNMGLFFPGIRSSVMVM